MHHDKKNVDKTKKRRAYMAMHYVCIYLLVAVTGVAGPCGLGSKKEITFLFSIQQKKKKNTKAVRFYSLSPPVIVPICIHIKIYINFNFFLYSCLHCHTRLNGDAAKYEVDFIHN